jgi:hypothetical protein
MSEQLKHHESSHGHEHLVSHERQAELAKEKQAAARAAQEKAAAEQDLDHLRSEIDKTAHESRLLAIEQHDKEPEHGYGTHQSLKSGAYKRTLKHIQQRLPKTARSFSKLVHSPTIESLSEVSSKTVARPSGLLGGSIGAFVGSAVLLYTTNHYGFRYNYSLFLLLFVGGFIAGLGLEFLVWLVWRRRDRA